MHACIIILGLRARNCVIALRCIVLEVTPGPSQMTPKVLRWPKVNEEQEFSSCRAIHLGGLDNVSGKCTDPPDQAPTHRHRGITQGRAAAAPLSSLVGQQYSRYLQVANHLVRCMDVFQSSKAYVAVAAVKPNSRYL